MLVDRLKLEPIKSVHVSAAPFVNDWLWKIELSQLTDVGSNLDLLKLRKRCKAIASLVLPTKSRMFGSAYFPTPTNVERNAIRGSLLFFDLVYCCERGVCSSFGSVKNSPLQGVPRNCFTWVPLNSCSRPGIVAMIDIDVLLLTARSDESVPAH